MEGSMFNRQYPYTMLTTSCHDFEMFGSLGRKHFKMIAIIYQHFINIDLRSQSQCVLIYFKL